MNEQIYVAVNKREKFYNETDSCGISYIGTLARIVYSISEDDSRVDDYDFYELGKDKLKLVTKYSVEKAK